MDKKKTMEIRHEKETIIKETGKRQMKMKMKAKMTRGKRTK